MMKSLTKTEFKLLEQLNIVDLEVYRYGYQKFAIECENKRIPLGDLPVQAELRWD
jgi:hypothetical protein